MPVQQSPLLAAKTSVPRPALPLEQANPLLKSAADVSKPLVVKYQIISRDGAEIIVGRIKVPTPAGHAFILRRFDTGAISLTTMFRAAFPDASTETEKQEANWVKSNYDTSGANGGGAKALRLAGTWVPVVLGLHLAPSYALTSILAPLATAVPESLQTYRSAAKSPSMLSHASPPPQLAPAPASTGPNKRRKESSPSPAPVSATLAVPATRTTRSKSRSPQPAPTPFRPSTKTPRTPASKATRASTISPTAAEVASDAEPEVPGPSMEDDIAEQRELIANLKAARAAEAAALANGAGPGMDLDVISTPSRKRAHVEEAPLAMNLDGPLASQEEIEARPKVAKRRLNLEPKHKAVAWGALAFAVGMGATAFLPSLFF